MSLESDLSASSAPCPPPSTLCSFHCLPCPTVRDSRRTRGQRGHMLLSVLSALHVHWCVSCLQACACVTASVVPSPVHRKPCLSPPDPAQECPSPLSVVTATLPFFFTVLAQVLLNHSEDIMWTTESPSMACSSDGMHWLSK